MVTNRISVKNVQAVKSIEFDMPDDDGGVVVLVGESGSGKTTVINCIASLLGDKLPLRPAEGSERGTIEGFGAKQVVGRVQKRTKGEADCESLVGRFSFSDLIDPPVKDPDARSKVRVKALAALTNAQADVADFYELFGGQEKFEEVVPGHDLRQGMDLLELSEAVKSAAERKARQDEDRFAAYKASVDALCEAADGADVMAKPKSVAELAAAHAAALNKKNRLEKAAETRAEQEKLNERVGEKLSGLLAAEPKLEDPNLEGKLAQLDETIQSAEEELRKARKSREEVFAQVAAHAEAKAEWERKKAELESLKSELGPEIQKDDVEAARTAAEVAFNDLELAEEAKLKYESAVKLVTQRRLMQEHQAEAEKLREAARSVGLVITKKLPKGDICVEGTEVMGLDGRRKKMVPFDMLSDGQRWKAGLQLAIAQLASAADHRRGRIVPVRQEAWQSLSTKVQNEVAAVCKEAKVWIVTAQVTDSELGAVIL